MGGEPPTNWDLQRQIDGLTRRADQQDGRINGIYRDFVTNDRLDRELRHIVDDLKEAVGTQKETATKMDAMAEKQREREEERVATQATQRRNLNLLMIGWLVSLVVAVASPIIVAVIRGT